VNKVWKQKWVEALKSGKYKQGKNYLRRGNEKSADGPKSHCCLGVLCEVVPEVAEAAGSGRIIAAGNEWHHNRTLGHNALTLTNLGPYSDSLMNMNDDGEYSFEDIAAWIETNVPEDAAA
jgi:hypothetical protein